MYVDCVGLVNLCSLNVWKPSALHDQCYSSYTLRGRSSGMRITIIAPAFGVALGPIPHQMRCRPRICVGCTTPIGALVIITFSVECNCTIARRVSWHMSHRFVRVSFFGIEFFLIQANESTAWLRQFGNVCVCLSLPFVNHDGQLPCF